jgi:RNA polymerase sigma factor (sigma-70 family)
MNSGEDFQSGDGTHARFPSQTHWTTLIQPAADPSSPKAQEALNQLCQTYWFPIYAFIRSERIDSHHAKDLTQGFFIHLLEKNLIGQVARDEGRFRSFLLACLRNFMKDEWRKENAQKRGGGAAILSIDETDAEDKYHQLPALQPGPEIVFDRTWASTAIEQAMQRLKQTYADRERLAAYESLKDCLNGKLSPENYSEAARKLGMTKQTFEVNLSRFKDAFGKSVRSVIAETVAPADLEDEIRYLLSVWAGGAEQKSGATTNPPGDSL